MPTHSTLAAAMTPPISAEFVYLETDAVTGSNALRRTVPVMQFAEWIPFIVAALMLVAGVIGYQGKSDRGLTYFIMVPLFTVVGLWLRWRIRRITRTNFRKSPHAGKTIRWRFDAEQAHIETDLSKSSFAWKALLEVKEVPAGFLLFSQPRYAHWIPHRAFGTEEALNAFREVIRGSGLKFRRLS